MNMFGLIETDIAIALLTGLVGGIAISALVWRLWPRGHDELPVSSGTGASGAVIIETNGEGDLVKLAAREGVAFDGAGDPGEPKPYKATEVPF